jgi:hypothetical protein
LFQAEDPMGWDVGVRLGAALRRAYQAEQSRLLGDGTHSGPRPSIRQAHWPGFWRGKLEGLRRFSLRWLPPVAVNVKELSELPAFVCRVE